MYVPKRKNKALCLFEEPNKWSTVATFSNNRQAFIFEKYLERFLGKTDSDMDKIKGYCKDCKYFMNNFEVEENDITDYEDVLCTYHMADGFTSYDYCSRFKQKGEEE